jgi:hypothetical protein
MRKYAKLLTQPEQPKLLGDTLLSDLKDTPTSNVGDAAKRVNHFTSEDEENHKRGVRGETRATIAKLKRWFLHVVFAVASGLVVFLAFGMCAGSWIYVSSFANDPAKLGSFLGTVGVWVLIALATLFIERVIPDRD